MVQRKKRTDCDTQTKRVRKMDSLLVLIFLYDSLTAREQRILTDASLKSVNKALKRNS